MQIPQKITERLVLDHPYRQIVEKDFKEKDGEVYTYLTIRSIGTRQGTMTLPITKSGDIILQKEYRVGTEEIIYQFSAGILEEDLTEIENCKKELKEETGYSSDNITKLGKTILEYYFDAHINYFIAKDCIEGEQNLEVGENIETLVVSKEKFTTMIQDGTINCPLTLACYTLAHTKGLI